MKLSTPEAKEIAELWLDEAEKRSAEIDAGADVLVSAEVVAMKAQALLRMRAALTVVPKPPTD